MPPSLRATTHSFAPLGAAEAASLRPYRIRIATARAGDTVESLAARMALTDRPLERFLILNGLPAGARLEPGTKVKLVE